MQINTVPNENQNINKTLFTSDETPVAAVKCVNISYSS